MRREENLPTRHRLKHAPTTVARQCLRQRQRPETSGQSEGVRKKESQVAASPSHQRFAGRSRQRLSRSTPYAYSVLKEKKVVPTAHYVCTAYGDVVGGNYGIRPSSASDPWESCSAVLQAPGSAKQETTAARRQAATHPPLVLVLSSPRLQRTPMAPVSALLGTDHAVRYRVLHLVRYGPHLS